MASSERRRKSGSRGGVEVRTEQLPRISRKISHDQYSVDLWIDVVFCEAVAG